MSLLPLVMLLVVMAVTTISDNDNCLVKCEVLSWYFTRNWEFQKKDSNDFYIIFYEESEVLYNLQPIANFCIYIRKNAQI